MPRFGVWTAQRACRRRRGRAGGLAALTAVLTAFALAACTSPTGTPGSTGTPGPGESATNGGAATSSSPTPTTPPPPPPLAWGPTEADVQGWIDEAAGLDLAEAAGQVIIARYSGTDPATPADLVRKLDLGGIVLFAGNIASLDQVIATGEAIQAAGEDLGRDWPTIVSADDEGGRVQRLSGARGPWTTFPSFSHAGDAPAKVVREAMAAMAIEQRASGLNTDFAPDADVTIGPADPTIGDRSASEDPDKAAAAVAAAVEGFTAGGVLSSLKHFPGHGALTVDSHKALPVQEDTTAELEERDLVPFRAGIEAGAPMVMMGHIDVEAWDPGVPASMSAAAYDYLREELGFTGVAITDGLEMGALDAIGDAGDIAVTAIGAGADLLLGPTDPALARQALIDAVEAGTLDRDRLNEAAGRVMAMMDWQTHLASEAGPVSPADVGSAKEAAAALAGY
ncbi:glycosyl hyrolase family 3 [Pseudactinotalea sp. HY158]|nr:glycosyl hyrolase family 3 [Pseudactinotalea sp. HY158]